MYVFSYLDKVLASYGVKYIFIESGEISIRNKIEELGEPESTDMLKEPLPKCWCELSWGSGEEDQFDAAVNAFGDSPGQALEKCILFFEKLVAEGQEDYVEIAVHFGLKKVPE